MSRTKKAFTLIEIIVAMAILLVVLVSTFAIFRASASSWRKGELRAQRYQTARFILERMTREIAAIVPASLAGPYCLGTGDKLYFVCSLKDAPGSLVELGYWLNENTKELIRGSQSLPDYDFSTFEQEEVLSEQVSALNFQYARGETWQENWDSRPQAQETGRLPQAVKISFEICDEKGAQKESFTSVVAIASAEE